MEWMKDLTFILGNENILNNIQKVKPFTPFCDEAILFLSDLSNRILKRGEKEFSDLTTFAFWCRKAHLNSLGDYNKNRIGRGVSLHFASSNIPLMFAYTFAVGILAGDSVIIRLSKKSSIQEEILIKEISALFDTHKAFKDRIVFVRYEHNSKINDKLSSMCDVRVIWGSDDTINEIRKSPLPPKSIDIPFPSRSSAVILKASNVLNEENLDLLVQNFYNDTYLNDQNACSSPKIVYWLGEANQIIKAKDIFWSKLDSFLKEKNYILDATTSVKKIDSAFLSTVKYDDVKISHYDNRITIVSVANLDESIWEYTMYGGFFIEARGETIDGILPILTRHCQTLCTYGIDNKSLIKYLIEKQVFGVDRVVNVGNALDFSVVWDGFNLIEMLSREIDNI